MPPEDEDEQPDWRYNRLKWRKTAAANRADAAPGNLRPGGGHPLSPVLSALESAWVSPSRERTVYAENLDGAGSAVRGAFTSQASSCRSEASAEPEYVDYDDPYDGWKASESRIDSRVSASRYYPGGY